MFLIIIFANEFWTLFSNKDTIFKENAQKEIKILLLFNQPTQHTLTISNWDSVIFKREKIV